MASDRAIAVAVVTGIFGVIGTVAAVVVPKLLEDKPAPGGGTPPSITRPVDQGNDGNQSGETAVFANKESAPVGATVQVSGRGFASAETIEIHIGAELVGTTRTGQGGDFANVSVKVPDFFKHFAKPMQVDINAVGKSSVKSARFALTISG